MSDLIDRAAAIEALGERPMNWNDTPEELAEVRAWDNAVDNIKSVPSVPAVPIRRTKPLMGVSRDQLRNWWQCGNCESVIDKGDRYCRGCGAEVEWDGSK